MNKREFLKAAGFASLGLAILPMYQCQSKSDDLENNEEDDKDNRAPFKLPELGFSYSALEPNIDAETMEIHYNKHHGGYVKKLNKAVNESDYKDKSLREILGEVSENEDDNDLRNNAGGHFNHTLFWEILLPGGSKKPNGKLLKKINEDFGSFEKFKTDFSKMALEVFGSGWTWLCVDKDQNLFIVNTENQDNPLMHKIAMKKGTPILGVDIWEHAYYLKYQNERKKYIVNIFNIINWDVVGSNFEKNIK